MKNNKQKIQQESEQIEEIKKLLPEVLDKLFPVPVEKLKWSKGIWFDPNEVEQEEGGKYRDVWHFPQTHPICEQDLIDHFSQKKIVECIAEEKASGWRGELFIELKTRETNHARSFCLISYGEKDMETVDEKLLPRLDYYGVEHIVQRFPNELRLWVFCNTSVWLLNYFVRKILKDVEFITSFGLHIAPIGDPVAVPIPGGYSLRSDSAGFVEFRGKTGNDPIFVMKSIIACKPVSEMQMLGVLQQPIGHKKNHPRTK